MSQTKFCYTCGQNIDTHAVICPACGVKQQQAVSGKKNKIVAVLLAFFLGGIGAHKFYLGRVWQGLLYLLFCWTGIPALIGFIEFIIYLCTSDENFAKKYG